MRVIVANDEAEIIGGSHKCAVLAARGLAKQGVETIFFYAEGKADATLDESSGVRLVSLNMPKATMTTKRLIEISWNQQAYDAMVALIKEGDPRQTIVNLHIFKVYLSPSVIRAALDCGAQVLLSMHDYHVACPQGQFFNVQTNNICKLKPGGLQCLTTHCTKSRSIIAKWAEVYRWSVQRGRGGLPTDIKHFVTFSQGSENVLRPFLPANAVCHRMRYPIQVSNTGRVDIKKNKKFVFSGRLSWEKNPLVLVEAARKADVELRFLGEGPLRGDIEAAGYEKCTISGWLTGDQLLEELKQARALVLPSIWYEVNPVAPMEALGLGIPVITSSDATTTEEIVHGETGYVFKSKDVDDLAEKLRLLSNDDHAETLSSNAYDRFWKAPPTEEFHVERFIEICNSILEPR